MAENKLGKFTTDTNRDAMHVACIPAYLGEECMPGTPVSIVNDTAYASGHTIGIVDPFLEGPIGKGRKVWVLIYPNQVQNLRHEWSHPLLEDNQPVVDDYADECRYC